MQRFRVPIIHSGTAYTRVQSQLFLYNTHCGLYVWIGYLSFVLNHWKKQAEWASELGLAAQSECRLVQPLDIVA